ncbi:NAD-P-binding protein [Amanita rubescens]|nr:NAD-P-binding protein [Amanita rubescens]
MLLINKLFTVKDKVILVTGGSRGVGKTIAAALIQNGAKVYITSRKVRDLQSAADELNALGPGLCIPLPANLQDYDEVVRLSEELKAREVMLHVLVNNAGAAWNAPLDEFPDAAFTKVLTLNIQRAFTLTQSLLPLLRAAAVASLQDHVYGDPARIINIGSVEGIGVPFHETYAYSASKAALHHLSRHLASRLGWEGITVNTIAFGWFESKMTEHSLNTPEKKEEIASKVPLQRIGQPEDIAGVVLFLASPSGAYVNGATLTVDGGWLVSDRGLKLRAMERRIKL